MADQERQDVVRMARATKLKAEDRISRRWDDKLYACDIPLLIHDLRRTNPRLMREVK